MSCHFWTGLLTRVCVWPGSGSWRSVVMQSWKPWQSGQITGISSSWTSWEIWINNELCLDLSLPVTPWVLERQSWLPWTFWPEMFQRLFQLESMSSAWLWLLHRFIGLNSRLPSFRKSLQRRSIFSSTTEIVCPTLAWPQWQTWLQNCELLVGKIVVFIGQVILNRFD